MNLPPSTHAYVTNSIRRMDNLDPLYKLEERDHLMVETLEGRMEITLTDRGVEVMVTNAFHRAQPELQVVPLSGNVILLKMKTAGAV